MSLYSGLTISAISSHLLIIVYILFPLGYNILRLMMLNNERIRSMDNEYVNTGKLGCGLSRYPCKCKYAAIQFVVTGRVFLLGEKKFIYRCSELFESVCASDSRFVEVIDESISYLEDETKYLGNYSAVDPAYSIGMYCDVCDVSWTGCWDNFQCPQCGKGDIPMSGKKGVLNG